MGGDTTDMHENEGEQSYMNSQAFINQEGYNESINENIPQYTPQPVGYYEPGFVNDVDLHGQENL